MGTSRPPTTDGSASLDGSCSDGRTGSSPGLDEGAERTGVILSIVATCIAHDINPRAYLHRVLHGIVHGWPQSKLRDLLPDRMLAAHPELFVGDPDALPIPTVTPALAR